MNTRRSTIKTINAQMTELKSLIKHMDETNPLSDHTTSNLINYTLNNVLSVLDKLIDEVKEDSARYDDWNKTTELFNL